MKKKMKRLITVFLTIAAVFSFAGCGGPKSPAEGESSYESALDVLNAVFDTYADNEKFAIMGGDTGNLTQDAPGAFDVGKTEELQYTLGLPEANAADIDDAASMVHMMNGNTFTGAAYRLKEGVDVNTFADSVKEGILNTQWMCGFPDKLIIINVDGRYVITAYGEAGIMDTFKANALSALSGAEVIVEEPIA